MSDSATTSTAPTYLDLLDPTFARVFTEQVFNLLNDVYFRTQFVGFGSEDGRVRPDVPLIYISNHSGMSFPWDAISFLSALFRRTNFDLRRVPRPIIAPILSRLGVMNPYFIYHFWHRLGGVDASYRNFDSLMHQPDMNVLIYPEGVPGIGKGFDKRYQLQKFATSFVRMALKHKTDIIPFATVNAEFLNPFTYNVGWVNRIVRKYLGIPFLPMGAITILLLVQPWMFYLAYPAKLTFVKLQRIRRNELSDKELEQLTDEEIGQIRDRVQAQFQRQLHEAVEQHGRQPFRFREFLRIAWQHRRYFPFFLPAAYPLLFREFNRQYDKFGAANLNLGWGATLRILWRMPWLLSYYIPVLGWIPIVWTSRKRSEVKGKLF